MARAKRPRVSFQGELGAFSHSAAIKLLGTAITLVPCPTFKDAFDSLSGGDTGLAVIPIENTLHGSVAENYDHLLRYDSEICGETSIRISHQLIAMPGTPFKAVRRAYSHPVALNQCHDFFLKYPTIEACPYYDTAGSVKGLREFSTPGSAAIASETAAAIYGGKILKRNIEDDRHNYTRFFLLSKQRYTPRSAGGTWKTSLAFATPNIPGALFKALACFSLRDLNLTKIESRPLRGKPFEYLFYVEFLGNPDDTNVKNALQNLSELTQFMKVLGRYRPTT